VAFTSSPCSVCCSWWGVGPALPSTAQGSCSSYTPNKGTITQTREHVRKSQDRQQSRKSLPPEAPSSWYTICSFL
jgi:hypothetical protein